MSGAGPTRVEDLPVRIVGRELPPELAPGPVITVDGAAGFAGLELSHWPGNRTPAALRHPLSTGIALRFARLGPGERARLAPGARAVCNNHYDTDGACALFAVHRPAEALPRAERLVAAARAGDFFEIPGEDALALDAIVGGLVDPERSPLALAGLGDRERHQLATDHLMEHLPAILDGDRSPYRALYQPVVERARRDLARLDAARRDDLVHLAWTVFTLAADGDGDRAGPGRHALFERSRSDRVLVCAPEPGGTRYRLVLSTRSWFDLAGFDWPSVDARPRPDLEALARELNRREGTGTDDALDDATPTWRTEPADGAAPELWFGRGGLERFSEHNPRLEPSALEARVVRRAVAEALRAALVLPG